MTKRKRRYYFSFKRTAEIEETGYLSVDAHNESDAHDAALEGLFTEYLCEDRRVFNSNWEMTPVESPGNDETN